MKGEPRTILQYQKFFQFFLKTIITIQCKYLTLYIIATETVAVHPRAIINS